MNITFYSIKNDRREVTKTVDSSTLIKTVTGNLKSDCDITNPQIELVYDSDLLDANYMYIPTFKRYYFLDPPKLSMQRIFFDGHIDYLMTWASDIRKLTCVVARQEDRQHHANVYLNDGMFRALQPKNVMTFHFKTNNGSDASFDSTGSFVLAVGGHS